MTYRSCYPHGVMNDSISPDPVPYDGLKTADEAALVQRLRAGDDDAFEMLVRHHSGRMIAAARRMLHSETDARDAVQDAFFSAFKSIDRFQGDASLATWLHRIVVNAALMKLRTRRRKPEESLEDLLPRYLDDGHRDVPDGDWRRTDAIDAERKETRQLVRECVERLPENYREVVLLRDIEEMSTQEAAGVLGLTENAVKVRLHRGRQALRALMAPHFSETQR